MRQGALPLPPLKGGEGLFSRRLGPRVKYFLQPGRSQPSFWVAITDNPSVVADSLPLRVVGQASPQVIDWVSCNKDALLDFWYHGDAWTHPEVNDSIQKLQPV